MRYRPCDELGADLHAAEQEWNCKLDLHTAEQLIEYVCQYYPPRADFEQLLEDALAMCNVEDETLRHGYKYALGLFFNRRAQAAREESRQRDAIPFAPR